MSAAVYRVFDAEDALLYVGLSTNPLARVMAHKGDKDWWDEVVRITVERFDSEAEAAAAEVAAIEAESPRHNISRTPRGVEARERRRKEYEAWQAELNRERERMLKTHYEPPPDFRCSNCNHRPDWVPKGRRLADGVCARCECETGWPNLKAVS